MNKRPYTDYVAWAMRHHVRCTTEPPKDTANYLNFECAIKTLAEFTEKEQLKILDSYIVDKPIDHELLRIYEKKFAKNRGLI